MTLDAVAESHREQPEPTLVSVIVVNLAQRALGRDIRILLLTLPVVVSGLRIHIGVLAPPREPLEHRPF